MRYAPDMEREKIEYVALVDDGTNAPDETIRFWRAGDPWAVGRAHAEESGCSLVGVYRAVPERNDRA